MNDAIKKLSEVYGELQEVTTPSGYLVTLRQQNGEDDDILTNGSTVLDGSAANNFIKAIVVKSDFSSSALLTDEDLANMKLADKYFIMLASRIFSLGANLTFDYDWGNGSIIRYEEDLNQYLWDHNDNENYPLAGEPEYFKYRIPPQKFGKDTERKFTLRSGKELSYKLSNSRSETYLMELSQDKQSKNQELLARGIALKEGDAYINVKNFKAFSAHDMMDIRKEIEENDPNLELFSDIKDPISGRIDQAPILGNPDFFFPREI